MKKCIAALVVKVSKDRYNVLSHVEFASSGTLEDQCSRISGINLDFGDNGYWPASDFTFVSPMEADKRGLTGWLSKSQRDFVSKNGMFVMIVKILSPPKIFNLTPEFS